MKFRRDSDHLGNSLSPYAGRWVARLRGKIVGQGGTPQQALQAAKAARHKETPEILFIPMSNTLPISPVIDQIRAAAPAEVPLHLVGGAVRDLLRGQPIHDYDFVLPSNALEASRKIANRIGAAYFPLDVARQTARLIFMDAQGTRHILDFASYRGGGLEADLRERDFTMNAMALDLRAPQELLDPLGGAADLQAKRLRACSPTSFSDDPVRVLRAVRMAASFGLRISPETREQIRGAAAGLANISPERLRDELLRILDSPHPHTSIQALEMLGALPYVLPELPALKGVKQSAPHVKDVWHHTLDTLRVLEGILGVLGPVHNEEDAGNLLLGLLVMRLGRYREQINAHLQVELVPDRPQRALLFLAALYHDIAKPQTRTVEEGGRTRFFTHDELGAVTVAERAQALHLSNSETERLSKIVRHHMRPALLSHEAGGPSKRAVYRFFKDTDAAGVDICLLSLADVWATYGTTLPQERWAQQLDTVRTLLEAWWEHSQEQVRPPALLNGNELMAELGLQPGPRIGEILEALREVQVEGVVSSRAEALAFARALATN